MNAMTKPEIAALLPQPSNFIGGAFVPGSGPERDVIYPATGEVLAQIRWSTPADVDAAVAAARQGFEIWRKTPPAARARVLECSGPHPSRTA